MSQTQRVSHRKRFTVIGIYKDNGQRFARDYLAKNAQDAESQAPHSVQVAGVAAGVVKMLDDDPING